MKIILILLLFTSLVYSFNLNFLKPAIQQADNVASSWKPNWKFWKKKPAAPKTESSVPVPNNLYGLADEYQKQALYYYQKGKASTNPAHRQFFFQKAQQMLTLRNNLRKIIQTQEEIYNARKYGTQKF
jgi:hypothetical protein